MSPSLLRTHILDTLELIADREAQLCYQQRAPHLMVSTELLLQWEDWYRPDTPPMAWAFEADELAALRAFHAVFVDVRNEVMFDAPPIQRFVQTAPWRRYHHAARATLSRLRPARAAA
ncbi:MAG: hypothetical protein AAGF11_09125 [Myxococcota bacterium]